MRRRGAVALAAALPLLAVSCQSLSDLVGDSSIRPSNSPVIAENVRSGKLARVGAAQHPKILATYGGEYSNAKLERMVAGIVGKLVTVSDNPSQVYQITILNSPNVNAFALPGGYLYITRGLLALANDTAELAAVIAHEMGHVTANHGILRQQKEAEVELASRVVSDVLSDKDAGRRALVRGKLRLAQFSRNQELQADAIGIAAIGEAGFDPYAAADFQKTMGAYMDFRNQAGDGDTSLDFLATHPSTPQRIELAIGHARNFGGRGERSRDRESYLAGIDGMLFGDSPEEGYVRGQTYAHAELGISFTFPDEFDIDNRADAVLGARASDNAAIRFDGVSVPSRQSLTTYIASGWVEGLDPTSVQALRINGLQAATARASADQWDFDITVVRAGNSVYRILTAMPRGSASLGPLAQSVRNSFRKLSTSEKRSLKPLTLRIVKAGPGESDRTLAARMRGVSRPLELFRVLNGMSSGETVKPGQSYKVVRD
ncbi:M48 family metalloprotease [Oricola sp.]|uniref:M48 family metalloprotease n=1 Tax=Oricola sp. TaxID=1979950 RepID=UPI0025F7B611|nr:M48 family metalloprotease [Oricola sp.]MCI5075148.1 M48 family metalloprotease [Oricola sp.]